MSCVFGGGEGIMMGCKMELGVRIMDGGEMETLLLLVSIPFLIFSIWIISFHWYVLVLLITKSNKRVPSMVPFIGGVFGFLFARICPFIENNLFIGIPFLIDPGVWIMFPPFSMLSRHAHRQRLASVGQVENNHSENGINDDE